MRLLRLLPAMLMMFVVTSANADVLVLVHGWASSADTWYESGVLPVLRQNGWSDAGVVGISNAGVAHLSSARDSAQGNRVYRVILPAEAPLIIQSAYLRAELEFIHNKNKREKIRIAAHSAGGVVARMVLVQPGAPKIDTLITIASPHLGTSRAIDALNVIDSKPFFCPGPGIDFVKSMVGGEKYQYLKYSRGVIRDLLPAGSEGALSWLNRQKHPDIRYYSVIKSLSQNNGDEMVPGFSQDLNQVPPIQNRAKVYVTHSGHALNPADGQLLAKILSQ